MTLPMSTMKTDPTKLTMMTLVSSIKIAHVGQDDNSSVNEGKKFEQQQLMDWSAIFRSFKIIYTWYLLK